MSTWLEIIGTFEVYPRQRERFMTGELWREWAARYPEIFDDDDLHIAQNQARLGYHFYEWLAAILLYETTGYLSLVEQYEFKNHKRKQQILQQLISSELINLIAQQANFGYTQCPDLFVYAPDFSDWFFCEVKGHTDQLSKSQERYFQALADLSGKKVRLIQFRMAQQQG